MMNAARTHKVEIVPQRFAVESSDSLNGTSADNRFLTSLPYSAVQSLIVFEIVRSVQDIEQDWEKDYSEILKRSPVLEELERQST